MRIDRDKLNQSLEVLVNSDSLTVLRIHLVDLDTLPEIISRFERLETMEIVGCNLSIIPESFSSFTTLKKLKINNNKIRNIPYISSLESLDVTENDMVSLPYKYFKSQNLKYLYLDNNEIKNIEINDIHKKNLIILSISGNNIPETQVDSLLSKLGDSVVVTSRPVE